MAGSRGVRGPIRIGSVKSNIGHLKSAAGAASLIKTSLAIHNKTLPPSINFENARPDVPFDVVPLQVQTRSEQWASNGPRRAGVSAFGFGGTNFHVVLEEHWTGGPVSDVSRAIVPMEAAGRGVELPKGVWGLSANSRAELIELCVGDWIRVAHLMPGSVRLTAAAKDADEQAEQVKERFECSKGPKGRLASGSGDYLEEEAADGKVAFLFTGQGSQYLDMGLDLAEEFEIVRQTFDEANAVMEPELGRPLTDYIRRDPNLREEDQFEALRATEISQPATLTIDVAILRLLAAYGVKPDIVAGHSLGEYAAAVAAGILSFKDALLAVSARGREMANVQIEDKGRMAGIASGEETVQEVLAEIPGYVVPANKNVPHRPLLLESQTR